MIIDKIWVFFRRHKAFFLCVVILVGAVALVAGMKALKSKPEEEKSVEAPLVVRTETATYQEQVVSATFQGVVRAKTNIELVTQVTGKVTSVSQKFIEGGSFEAGETLVQIDDADYQVALRSAEANVASAQVDVDIELATAATNAKEWLDLQGKPIEEANPLRLNKPQIDRARARLNAAKAELAAARLNYDRTKISAPFAGRIMTKTAELGQFMSRGSSVGRVFATDAMEIRIPMTDVQIGELGVPLGYSAPAENAQGIPAKVSALFGIEQRAWQGYLKNVDANVDNETRLLFATIVVDQPFAANTMHTMPLVPGLFVDVELESPVSLKGIQMPRAALKNGTQVYVMEGNSLRLKHVDVIYTSAAYVVVKDNDKTTLNAGEQVIVTPVPGAYEGMPVKVPETVEPLETAEPEAIDPDEGAEEQAEPPTLTS